MSLLCGDEGVWYFVCWRHPACHGSMGLSQGESGWGRSQLCMAGCCSTSGLAAEYMAACSTATARRMQQCRGRGHSTDRGDINIHLERLTQQQISHPPRIEAA
jgi:hypothetical protein